MEASLANTPVQEVEYEIAPPEDSVFELQLELQVMRDVQNADRKSQLATVTELKQQGVLTQQILNQIHSV